MIRAAVIVVGLAAASVARADDGFELRSATEVTVTPGTASTVSLTIAGTGGRTISKDGPVRIEVASSTLELPRTRYARRDAADPAADAPRFDLRFTAGAAGDHELAIEARFWVCGKRVCRPVQATRTVTVHATAPEPAAPAP